MNKTTLLLCSLLGAATSALAQGPVYSVNIVGIQKVPVPGQQLDFVSTPFNSGSNTLDDILKTQAEPGTDEVFVWDVTTSNYKKFILFPPGIPGSEDIGNRWVSADDLSVANFPIGPGSGFIFKNSMTAGATNTISVVGDVVMAPSVAKTVPVNLSIQSYPYSSIIALNSCALSGPSSPANAGDEIFMWNVATQNYKKYIYVGSVGDPGLDYKWLDSDTAGVTTVELVPGDSFFYKNNGAQFTWTETKPY